MIKIDVNHNRHNLDDYTVFPFLGVADNGDIVLFIAKSTGMMVHKAKTITRELANDDYKIGEYSENWANELFTPLVGGITITNI